MRGNELIPDPAWGSTPELGLTVSEQSRGFAHAEQWVALWAVRLVGHKWGQMCPRTQSYFRLDTSSINVVFYPPPTL